MLSVMLASGEERSIKCICPGLWCFSLLAGWVLHIRQIQTASFWHSTTVPTKTTARILHIVDLQQCGGWVFAGFFLAWWCLVLCFSMTNWILLLAQLSGCKGVKHIRCQPVEHPVLLQEIIYCLASVLSLLSAAEVKPQGKLEIKPLFPITYTLNNISLVSCTNRRSYLK